MSTVGARQALRGVDLGLLTITILLVLFGLAALYSFSIHLTQPDYTIFIRQVIFTVIGLGLIGLFIRLDYRLLGGVHGLLYGFGLLLLVAVRLFGTTVHGTTGWFEIAGFQLQPVEVVKVIMAIVLAKYFSDHSGQLRSWRVIATSAALALIPVGLVLLQPDLGSAVILLGMWLGLLLVLPLPRRWLGLLGVGLAAMAAIGWLVLLAPYQKDRILNFISPGRDPLGAGYNVRQAVTAVGSGEWFGRGLGLGTQSQLNFLPERQTDFIFASISEELGLIGSLGIVFLYVFFFWRLARLVRHFQDDFSVLVCLALGLMFFIQAAINIGMNIGLFPVTGIPLPFLSYGGSSLLMSLISVGIIESVIIRQRRTPL